MLLGHTISSNPGVLALAIFAGTFLLEDATMVAAALLAASGMLPAPVAFVALYAGIVVSDWGLYGLGAAARSSGIARRIIGEDRITKAGSWLRGRLLPTLIGVRLVPGSRLPAYTASGFLRVPFRPFAAITATMSFLWTATIFTSVLFFGVHAALLGPWKYAGCAMLGAIVIFGPSFWLRLAHRGSRIEVGCRA
jgi:membrane protein DedA with SNARE-associated domain